MTEAMQVESAPGTKDLEARVAALEAKRFQCPPGVFLDDSVRRARAAVEGQQLYSARWKWVPETYYQWSLRERSEVLGAPSTFNLCKSLLLENKKVADNPSLEDPLTNPRFLMVIIQYEATLDTKKLSTSMRRLRPVESRLEESQFDYRVASSEDNDRITGYAHNSVTPFGLKEPVLLVLSAAIVPLQYFWMGGGHIHLKLGMAVSDFCKLPNARVMELSNPRNPDDAVED